MEKEMGTQTCEVCMNYLPADPFEECACRNRQDAIWYSTGGQNELVCEVAGTRLAIYRVGYTRFIFLPNKDEQQSLYTTKDFEAVGIKDDTDLRVVWDETRLEIDDSPWFEIYDKQTGEFREQDATFTGLDEAYNFALRLPKNERNWTE